MTSRPPTEKAQSWPPVAVQAEQPLRAELCTELQRAGFVVLPEGNVLTAALSQRALVICEVREATEALAQQLLSEAGQQSLLFIGPTGMPLVAARRNVRELSADVSAEEVVRVCLRLASELPSNDRLPSDAAWAAPPTSQRAAPYNVLPRVSEAPTSMQPVQAPLFPSSVPPSSKPKAPPRVPSLPPVLADGGFVDDAPALFGAEISRELSRVLAEAEQRVAKSLAPRGPVEAEPFVGELALNQEILAALEDPIGDYEARTTAMPSSVGSLAIAASTGMAPPVPESGARSDESAATHARLSPLPGPISSQAPSASAPSYRGVGAPVRPADPGSTTLARPKFTSDTHSPEAAELGMSKQTLGRPTPLPPTSRPPASDGPSTRPPSRSTLGTNQPPSEMDPLPPVVDVPAGQAAPISSERITARPARRMSPIPPAPGLPRDSWLHATIGTPDSASRAGSHAPRTRSAPPPDFAAHGPVTPPRTQRRPTPAPTTPPPRSAGQRSPAHATPSPTGERQSQPPSDGASDSRFPTEIPPLRPGDSVALVAAAIRQRYSGSLAFEEEGTIRRLVLKDGDLVTAASSARDESLVSFLVREGTLRPDVAAQLGHKIPNLGRHAGAALIAAGHLPQSQLWPVLRAHAEFVITRALSLRGGSAEYERSVPARLREEPAVFGGATGSEVFIELLRRAIDPEEGLRRLGGVDAELQPGAKHALLEECALAAEERQLVEQAAGASLSELLASSPSEEFPCVLYGLTQLQVLRAVVRPRKAEPKAPKPTRDRLDDQAMRQAILARKGLVENADYFALLGVSREATGYDVRRAYLRLRRNFDPSVALTASTLDLREELDLVLEVLDEAYDVLRDSLRRERYKRAIESLPA